MALQIKMPGRGDVFHRLRKTNQRKLDIVFADPPFAIEEKKYQ